MFESKHNKGLNSFEFRPFAFWRQKRLITAVLKHGVKGMQETIDELLTAEEISRALRVSLPTIYKWAREGKLHSIRIGRIYRFQRADIEKVLAENTFKVVAQRDCRVATDTYTGKRLKH
jgi:excisionase family DNA binding protein